MPFKTWFAPRRKVDLLLAVGAILVGAGSLSYPFGWDTSVHYYVGREWALRGAIPYRDTFDHKTPGIHAIHAALVAVFGEGMWAIRAFELACVVAMGFLAASAVSPRGRAPRAGARGFAAFATSLFYYGLFDHWNTAQCELSCAALALASLVAARRSTTALRAGLFAGVLAGAAICVKPVVAPLLVVVVVAVALRARRDRRRVALCLGAMAASASLLPLAFVAYFAAHRALPAMIDVLGGANAYYFEHERPAATFAGALRIAWSELGAFSPLAPCLALLFALSLASALVRRDRSSLSAHALAAAMALAAGISVFAQAKFYVYHWSLLTVAVALGAAAFALALPRAPVLPAATLALVVAFARTPASVDRAADLATTVRWLTARASRDEFLRRYDHVSGRRPFSELDATARFLRDHTLADDLIDVRGVSAEIYVLARRRAPSRFFWTAFLDDPTRAYRREEWRREDEDALRAHPPRYVVLHPGSNGDVVAWFAAMDYVPARTIGAYRILGRATK